MGISAVITGASSGIGKAVADKFTTYRIPVLDISTTTLGVDVTDEAAVRRAYSGFYSAPELLVANAGISVPMNMFSGDIETWRRVIDVNVTGAFIVAREHAARLIAAKKSGRIMFLGSPSGRRPSFDNMSYGVSKAALQALGLGMARSLEMHDIKVYVLCPSHVDTPMLRSRFNDLDESQLMNVNEIANEVAHLMLDANSLDGQPIYVSKMVVAKQQ